MQLVSNDHLELIPKTEFAGPALAFDFPSMLVGIAEYEEGPTGCTVFYFPARAEAATDIRGGSHATIFSTEIDRVDAICLAGGSQLGLEASTGVASELLAMRGYSTNWQDIPLVAGAIIYDYGLRPTPNAVYPDKALGRASLRAAKPGTFPLGPRGAGRSASVGKALLPQGYIGQQTGQGGAFRQIGGTSVAVFTVVNALGAIVDRSGKVVRGNYDPTTDSHLSYIGGIEQRLGARVEGPQQGNTTLTVVVTNQKLDPTRGSAWALRQLARVVHTSMARAIQPFHTIYDGDVLYAVTTNEITNPALDDIALSAIASELAWDAVLNTLRGHRQHE